MLMHNAYLISFLYVHIGAAIGLPNQFLHRHGKGGGVIQGSASESVIVSMLAARSRAFEKHNLSSGTRLVAYCSELVRF